LLKALPIPAEDAREPPRSRSADPARRLQWTQRARPLGPSYQPAADAPDEQPGPVFDDNNPPTWTDLVKANRSRKGLKDLKP
jgi:hypothetical protein